MVFSVYFKHAVNGLHSKSDPEYFAPLNKLTVVS